jgi:hypothetical protein
MIKRVFFGIALYILVSSPLGSYPHSTDVFLTTDVTAPLTTPIVSGISGNQGWFTGPVSVTLNASDDESGVANTFYTINNFDDDPVQTYTTPLSLTFDNNYRIEFWSVDVAGNTESHKTITVRIDSTAPLTQAVSAPLEFEVGLFPTAAATADLNNDAHLDILVANSDTSVSLLFGDGRGQFGSRRDLITPQLPIDVLAADFNNDGNQDVVAIGGGHFTTNGWVFLGDGTGGFGSPITFSTAPVMNSVTSADLNRDGNLDLVIGRQVTFATVLFGNGTGGFPSSISLPAGSNPMDVATGDFNKDGKIDVATANLTSQNIILFFGDGAGGIASTQSIGTFPQLLHVTVADLNADGNSDLLATTDTKFHIFLGAGDGSFSSPITRNFPGSTEKEIAVGDYNSDRVTDVIILEGGFKNCYVLLGTGDGNVNLEATISLGNPTSLTGSPRGLMTGDFNEDGISDIGLVRTNLVEPRTLPAKVAVFLTTDLIVPSTSVISSPISVTLNALDHMSGVASTFYTINGGPVQTYTTTFPLTNDGAYNVEYWSVDVAGNTETPKTFVMRIDSTAPHTQALVSGSAGTNGWYVSEVQISLSATDNVSGARSTFYRIDGGAIQTYTGPFVISALGQHTVEYWSVDNLKNTEVAQSLAINIDTIVPTTTDLILPSTTVISSPVSVTLNASDSVSGVANTFFNLNGGPAQTYTSTFTISNDGAYNIEYWSVDMAGNTEIHKTRTVRIDSTAPHTQAFVSGTAGANGWYVSNVQLSLTATDNVSGVQSMFYRIDGGAIQNYSGPFVISALGQHTVEYWSVDNLNNTEAAQSLAVNVDTIAPIVMAAANPSTASKKPQPITVTISGSVTDSISGVSSASFSVIDEYGATQPSGSVTLQANGNYSFTLTLPATKNGPDKDGHLYTILVTASDRAGIPGTATAAVRIN